MDVIEAPKRRQKIRVNAEFFSADYAGMAKLYIFLLHSFLSRDRRISRRISSSLPVSVCITYHIDAFRLPENAFHSRKMYSFAIPA